MILEAEAGDSIHSLINVALDTMKHSRDKSIDISHNGVTATVYSNSNPRDILLIWDLKRQLAQKQ